MQLSDEGIQGGADKDIKRHNEVKYGCLDPKFVIIPLLISALEFKKQNEIHSTVDRGSSQVCD